MQEMFLLIISTCFSLRPILANSDCIGTCYSGDIYPNAKDIHPRKHLQGVSYKNITTDDQGKCYRHCVQDCRCKACQMRGTRCELLDEYRSCRKGFVKDRAYSYMDIKQKMFKGKSHMVQSDGCYNGCCKSQPCLNGGTCVERCESFREKFTCKCTELFHGVVCEKSEMIKTCRSLLSSVTPYENLTESTRIYNINSNSIYCDIQMHPKTVWTLIESFSISLPKNRCRKKKPLDWSNYKLDDGLLEVIRQRSSFFRVTCDFPNRTTLEPDHLLGKLEKLDITEPNIKGCKEFVCIEIAGEKFINTTAFVEKRKNFFSLRSKKSYPKFKGCGEKNRNDCTSYPKCEFNCMTSNSNIQYWLGEEFLA